MTRLRRRASALVCALALAVFGAPSTGAANDDIAAAARQLQVRADRLWQAMQAIPEENRPGHDLAEGLELVLGLQAFSTSTRMYATLANEASERASRGGARYLIAQAEDLDWLFERVGPTGELRSEWQRTEKLVAELAKVARLPYRNGELPAPAKSGVVVLPDTKPQFKWRGTIDGANRILLRGHEVELKHLTKVTARSVSYELYSPLPARKLEVRLSKRAGRGRIKITEQPTEANRYTAVISIDDTAPRADIYEFELSW